MIALRGWVVVDPSRPRRLPRTGKEMLGSRGGGFGTYWQMCMSKYAVCSFMFSFILEQSCLGTRQGLSADGERARGKQPLRLHLHGARVACCTTS
jgi:hypothetical protein